MFGSLGVPEILFILVVALLVFGPRRLPEIGRTIGKALGEFRRATTDLKRSIDTEVTLEEVRREPPPSPVAPATGTPAGLPAEPAAKAPAPAPVESRAATAPADPRPVQPAAGEDDVSD